MMKFSRVVFGLVCLLLIIAAAWNYSPLHLRSLLSSTNNGYAQTVSVATGPESGMYNSFGRAIAELRPEHITLVASEGSVDNIQKLRNSDADFILVQDDIAQDVYFGDRGEKRYQDIRYVWPVFVEYVQVVVPQSSKINVLADLRGKQICVGGADSGTYLNALDVLNEVGLRETVDFFPINKSSKECIADIRRGQPIAAIFSTSHQVLAENEKGFRQLFLSDQIAADLIRKSPHFKTQSRRSKDGTDTTQLAVETYLATRANVPDEKVELITRILISDWTKYRQQFPEIRATNAPSSEMKGNGIAFHRAVNQVPGAERVIGNNSWIDNWKWFALVIFGICLISIIYKGTYDRVGQKIASSRSVDILLSFFAQIAKPIFLIVGVIAIIFGLMQILVWVEDNYAQANGLISPFATMSDDESVIWLTAYVGSGFTSDIYPVSLLGRGILAVMGIAMAIGPFSFVISLIDKWRKKQEAQRRGLGRVHSSGHILLCGWNEKAEGIIYGLTGTDIDERQQVTIVANMVEDAPLDAYGFDQAYVSFIRGDASDIKVLNRANVTHAKAALVLADFGGDASDDSATWNRKSILATFNVEAAKESAHICAEMEYLRGLHYYRASGANALVHPNTVVTRMTTMAIIHPLLLDYVIDMISYHDFDELYSESVGTLTAKLGCKHTLDDIRRNREKFPVNIMGVIRKSTDHGTTNGVESATSTQIYDASFGLDSNLVVWEDNEELNAGDHILYSAKRDHSLYTASPLVNALKGVWSFARRLDAAGLVLMIGQRLPRHGALWIRSKLRRAAGNTIDASPQISTTYEADIIHKHKPIVEGKQQNILLCFDARSTAEGAQISSDDEHRTALARFIEDVPMQLASMGWGNYSIETCFEDELDSLRDRLAEFHRIFVMTTPQIRSRSSSIEQVNDVDTGLILLTKRVHQLLVEAGIGHDMATARIASELLNFHNRDLLTKAGVGDILPSALLVGRFIAKQAVHLDHASDFLMALMNLSDGTHLYLHEVSENDPVFAGKQYSELLCPTEIERPQLRDGIDNYRLLGWLPSDPLEMERLSNNPANGSKAEGPDTASDYAHHFVTVIDYRFPDRPVAIGDKLVLLVRRI
jgi:TRAP transporter TAXI family solute receptor